MPRCFSYINYRDIRCHCVAIVAMMSGMSVVVRICYISSLYSKYVIGCIPVYTCSNMSVAVRSSVIISFDTYKQRTVHRKPHS